MRSLRFVAALCAALCVLAAAPALAAVNVVTTLPDLAALTKAVGGDLVKVQSMALGTQDPHRVDAKPSLALALRNADLLVCVGLDLEVGWLPNLQTGSRNPRIQQGNPGFLNASQFVRLLEVPPTKVDRSEGDVHPGGNPHYLYDPRQGAAVARGIAERLAQLDAKNAATYRANAARLTADLDAARVEWEKRLAGLKGAPVVAFHRTTAYLADWLGFEAIAFLEPKPGIPPNPSHVAGVLVLARQRKARMVLIESYYNDREAKMLAGMIPAPLVILHGGTDFRAGETYLQHINELVGNLEKGLNAGKGG
ncbi:zinc/manganese transport system substrate-binding protein [Myxococcus fulvus]|uniref:Zinc ABC transporter substrate-binding protein n=1 Tax=Myxococcus fulvus TaxID=33 RepID=A0A511T5M0_MYXFU|nr:metal ABC transporter substrate-binding protein [Myxococcus fulvus]AKF81165.1 ABC transporter substrate-binding protein [Myxococcus fulvus 124B02]GEN09476.1 zinc ABC transporter substrate-binding protein [Myxococcus fulvus]SEU32467.1 zinc/manganese transport system substrate-binding protein [Myxococcus fulvus]